MLDDTWQSRDFPVLLEVAGQSDQQPRVWLSIAQVAEATGLDEEDVKAAAY